MSKALIKPVLRKNMKSFVLKGDVLYSESKDKIAALENAYVVCVGGVCKGVFKFLPSEYQGLETLDFSGKLIIPGLCDLHVHASQYAFRGLGMDMELMDWLSINAFPEESKFACEEYANRAYEIFVDALKKSATTRACIFATRHEGATFLLMQLLEDTGLVTKVGKVNMDEGAPADLVDESAQSSVQETQRLVEKSREFVRTKYILTPRFIPCCSDETLAGLEELQCKFDLPVQSHLSENYGEIEWVLENRDVDFYGQGYDKFGLMGKSKGGKRVPTIMAHCVHSGDREVELMKQNGVFVAHCPASNDNLCSGVAPVSSYLDKGLKVGLGSDVAGGQTESIFRAMVDAVQASKLRWRLFDKRVKPITFANAFYLATKGGGEFFGKVGSFEDGYEFDAVVLDDSMLPHPQSLDLLQRLERFAYLSGDLSGGVAAKFVQGECISL